MRALAVICPVNVAAIDEPDPKAGNASHTYAIQWGGPGDMLVIQFQHGPRGEAGSKPGIFEDALLAILEDRLRGFQSGEFRSVSNDDAITCIVGARNALGRRVADRMGRGVLGVNKA